jgi:hypothetical protein
MFWIVLFATGFGIKAPSLSAERNFCQAYVDGLFRAALTMKRSVRRGDHNDLSPRDGGGMPAFIGQALAGNPLTIFGDNARTVHKALPGDDPKVRQPDIVRAKNILGRESKVEFREEITRTIQSFREWRNAPANVRHSDLVLPER